MTTHFVATRHPDYPAHPFPVGSVVVDPFRYIPDRPGITVKRIGQNRPDLISILVPSRGRPHALDNMIRTARTTATHARRLEIIVYLDDDDAYLYNQTLADTTIIGPRILLSQAWNECAARAAGTILMHCGDDVVFRTPAWDSVVRGAFAESQDKILLVHGDDRSPNTDLLATHGFLHRRWVDTLGYFLPPYFSSDWNDVWLTDLADMIGRRRKVPIVTEHMHYSFDKRPHDQTDAEREQRGRDDDVVGLYKSKHAERVSDAYRLKAAMA